MKFKSFIVLVSMFFILVGCVGDLASLTDAGIFMLIINVEADAEEFAIHTSDEAWLAYVISGTGVLFAGNLANEKTKSSPIKAVII